MTTHTLATTSDNSLDNLAHSTKAMRIHFLRSPRVYQLFFDTIAFAVSFVVYYAFRFLSGLFETSVALFTQPFVASESSWLLAFATVVLFGYWVLIFWFAGLYADWYVRSPFDEFFTVVRVTFIGCCVLGVLIFLDDLTSPMNTRLLVLLYWLALCISIATGRIIARVVQRFLRKKGIITFQVLLVGCAEKIHSLVDSLKYAPEFGFQPIGVVLNEQRELDEWNARYRTAPEKQALRIWGTFAEMPSVLDSAKPDSLIVAIETPNHEELLRIANECEERHITMKIVPDLYEIFSGQTRTQHIYGISLIEISAQIMTPWQKVIKRLTDIILSACILLVGMPVWITVALVVMLETPGGAIYRQTRIGRYGVPFTIYKFRSMFSGSDKRTGFTQVNDARVTRFGRFIRKTHLDEIPQLWNILKGDMSLVGPRPEVPALVERFTNAIPYYPRRHKVRPGLTGWWQISYNYFQYQETIEGIRERLVFDFYYIENISFRLDLEIIARTAVRVFKGHGQA